jgi:PBP1b-binding outer membrane lipoprotein LpoB
MKTKNLFRFGFLMIAAMTILFAGCSKDKTTTKDKANTESMQQLTNDEGNFDNATDQAMNDANSLLSSGKLKSTESGPCGATWTIGPIVNDSITIDIIYNGDDCNHTHFRTGHIALKAKYLQEWSEAGATVIMTLDNFYIRKNSNMKSITLNGTKHLQNYSGHYLFELGLDSTVTSVVHRVWGAITATFDDNTSKNWFIDRQRTFTGSLINLVVTDDGLGSADGYTNLATWGTTRNGELFYTHITQSVVHKQVCNFNPCSGVIIHEIPAASKSATITFGYDINNNLITNGDCPARYRLDWVVGGYSGTFFLPLY